MIWLGLIGIFGYVFHRGWSVLESRGKWHPNGKSEEGVARKGRNHQGLKNSIAFNGERKVQKGDGVLLFLVYNGVMELVTWCSFRVADILK